MNLSHIVASPAERPSQDDSSMFLFNNTRPQDNNYRENQTPDHSFEVESQYSQAPSRYSGSQNNSQLLPSSLTNPSKMSRGKQKKISSQALAVSSPMREAMLFIALACSTMQHFAMIILIPFICAFEHSEIKSYEIGIIMVSSTAGELISSRFTEPSISKIGSKWAI